MSQSGGQSEARPPVFKSPSKLGTHLSTHCIMDERLSQSCPAREYNPDLWCESTIRYHSTTENHRDDNILICNNTEKWDVSGRSLNKAS
ncbi:hypothetical protein TNCV_758171 [Trichonephila clavipes]|nr:hypothetical protein TNCV_758171 [Trichonephila clavipes]